MAGTTMNALEKMLKEFTKNTGDRPYAFFCNKKTFEKIEREMRTWLSAPQTLYKFDRNDPLSICFDGIPIYKSKGCPDDKIYAFNKETTLKIGAGKFPRERQPSLEAETKRQRQDAERASKTIQEEICDKMKERRIKC